MIDNQKYSVVSLFSGAGGFDWGFHHTGRFQTYLACEILAEPASTLARNLGLEIVPAVEPIAPKINGKPILIQGDIQLVDFSQVGIQPHVLIGGPPCQDFSITISKRGGGRPGLNGGRGKLYIEFIRAVMSLQPRFFVFENVEGLMSANEGAAYSTILGDLQNLESKRLEELENGNSKQVPVETVKDYSILFSGVVYAPNVGVPQTRRRLIIVGMRRDLFDAFHLFEQQEIKDRFRLALSGENSLLARFPLTCIEVFEGLPLPELQEKYSRVMSEYSVLACHPQLPKSRAWYDRVWSKLRLDDIRHDYFLANQIEDTDANRVDYQTAMQLHREILADLGWLGRPVHEQSFDEDDTQKQPRLTKNVIERMAMIPPDENHEFVKDTPWTVEGKDISFIYRRAAPLKPAWTVMAYGGGGTYGYHYERSRAQLTLRERARIQTFTDDFVFMSSKVRAQIGEAVPPLMGKHIAQNIIHTLEMVSTKSAQQIELAAME